jgi:L-amino acid N-acyltransferase YncA
MDVRAATLSDLPDIQAIYAHAVRTGFGTFEEEPPAVEEMQRRFLAIKERAFPYLVSELDGRIAGYAYAGAFRPRSAYRHTCESSVYVAHDAQRRGVARALMLRVIADCQALGQQQMLAVIGDSGNLASIGLHAALGFQHVGVFKSVGLKFGRWVDVVLMQRELQLAGWEAFRPR